MNDSIKNELIKLVNKAEMIDEVPVACVVTYKNKIISKSYNQKIKKKNPLAHAEIIAIKKASKKLKTWNLKECEIYVTMKPCKMCECVIKEARINKIYYYIDNNKIVNNKLLLTKINDEKLEKYFLKKIQFFFQNKR